MLLTIRKDYEDNRKVNINKYDKQSKMYTYVQ
jgi:hypothetical protein